MPNFIDAMVAQVEEVLRPNRFKVKITFPAAIVANDITPTFEYYCIATDVPSRTIGTIEVPLYGGKKLKIPGDSTIPDWSCTIIQDKGMKIYKAMQRWCEFIDSYKTGLRANPLAIFGAATVQQMDNINQPVQTWEMALIFPTDPGNVSMSKDDTDTYAQFDVNWTINDILTDLF